jgi:hypothetical protein
MSYQPRFYELLAKAEVDRSQLPDSLRILIEKFEEALNALNDAEPGQHLMVMVKTDAVISAKISSLFNVLPSERQINVDKAKVMALKAKALHLKWKMQQG